MGSGLRILAGTGYGTTFQDTRKSYSFYLESHPAVPIEVGVEWNFLQRFNIVAGYTSLVPVNDGVVNHAPFIGVGYVF